jgi:hypothetical protein
LHLANDFLYFFPMVCFHNTALGFLTGSLPAHEVLP